MLSQHAPGWRGRPPRHALSCLRGTQPDLNGASVISSPFVGVELTCWKARTLPKVTAVFDPFRTPHEVCDGMTLPARQAAQKSWRGLDGHHQLPRIIELKFADGLGVTAKPNRPSARNRRRMIHQAVTKISRCSGLLTGLSAWQSTDKPRWSTLLAGEQIPLSSHGGAL